MDESDNEVAEKAWQREVLQALDREMVGACPITRFLHGVRFLSTSKGRGRKRSHVSEVILIKYGLGRWRTWNGGDDGNIPWDEWAQEIFNEDFLDSLRVPPGDYLRYEVLRMLNGEGVF